MEDGVVVGDEEDEEDEAFFEAFRFLRVLEELFFDFFWLVFCGGVEANSFASLSICLSSSSEISASNSSAMTFKFSKVIPPDSSTSNIEKACSILSSSSTLFYKISEKRI